MNQKNARTLYLLVLVVIAAVFIVSGVYYFRSNGSESKPAENPANNNIGENNDNQNAKVEELSPDQQLYVKGINSLEAKKYDEAIDYFRQAISENPNVISYYSLKSEAEVLANKKDDAKATLEAGLKIDPDNELLNSKLDQLNKTDSDSTNSSSSSSNAAGGGISTYQNVQGGIFDR